MLKWIEVSEDGSEKDFSLNPEVAANAEENIPVENLRFFILHGSFQLKTPRWEAQFRNHLTRIGVKADQVHTPHLKNLYANYRSWRKDSSLPNKEEDSANTVLIGHSSGAEMTLVYAEHHQVAGIILFSPYDNPDIGSKGLRPFLRTVEKSSGMFTKRPKIPEGVNKALWQSDRVLRDFRWDRIARNCGFITIVHSKGDHIVSEERTRSVYDKLVAAAQNLDTKWDSTQKVKYLSLEGSGHNPEEKQFDEVASTIPGLASLG